MNRTDFQNNLPRLNTTSQLKFRATSKGHIRTQQGRINNDSKANTIRQHASTNYASKAVKYETSGIIYSKKKQEEEFKLKNIEDEIRLLEKELERRRSQVRDMKRKRQPMVSQEDISIGSVDFGGKKDKQRRKLLNLNDPKEIQNEITLVKKKEEVFRKKINLMRNDNKCAQTEVDKYRMEINTIKEHLDSITRDIVDQSSTFQTVSEQNRTVSQEVARTHLELHRKKAEKAHQETKKLKRYDQILRTITREIQDQKLKTNSKPNFYMTEVNMLEIKSPTKRISSPARRRLNLPLGELQQLLRGYEEQFQKIRTGTGTQSLQEVGEQYIDQQKETYALYKFINGLSEELTKKLQSQDQLKQRLEEAKEESKFKYSQSRQIELDEVVQKLEQTRTNNKKHRENSMKYERIVKDLKLSVPVLLERLKMDAKEYPQISEYNLNKLGEQQLIPLLLLIQKRKGQILDGLGQPLQPRGVRINQVEVQQQLESARKEFVQFQRGDVKSKEPQTKYDKFQEQSEILKTIEFTKSKKDKKSRP